MLFMLQMKSPVPAQGGSVRRLRRGIRRLRSGHPLTVAAIQRMPRRSRRPTEFTYAPTESTYAPTGSTDAPTESTDARSRRRMPDGATAPRVPPAMYTVFGQASLNKRLRKSLVRKSDSFGIASLSLLFIPTHENTDSLIMGNTLPTKEAPRLVCSRQNFLG